MNYILFDEGGLIGKIMLAKIEQRLSQIQTNILLKDKIFGGFNIIYYLSLRFLTM